MIAEKPFLTINFTLAAGAFAQYETSSGACLKVIELDGTGLALQFDENDIFTARLFDFVRVQRFDKLRIFNNSGIALTGSILVSADPDFLFLSRGA